MRTASRALSGWCLFTLAFELSFGRLVVHASWYRLLSDYDLRHGGFVGVGLLALALAPLLAGKARRVFQQRLYAID